MIADKKIVCILVRKKDDKFKFCCFLFWLEKSLAVKKAEMALNNIHNTKHLFWN